MEKDIAVYVSVLHDSLRNKCDVLQELLDITKEQEQVLSEEEMDFDEFDEMMKDKDSLIQKIQELDQGFQNVYDKIGSSLKEHAEQFKGQIVEMQAYIRKATDCGVKIQALEHSNKEKFAAALAKKRRKIHNFNKSNKTAVSYSKNMANQHQAWQSYFMDKKE